MLHPATTATLSPKEIVSRIEHLAGPSYEKGRVDHGDAVVAVTPNAWPTLFDALRTDSELSLVWQFRSLSKNLYARVNTRLADGEGVDSATRTFASANYLEREVYDLFGIDFRGHPNLKRILLPQEYEGHPLRKEYPVEGPNFPEDAHRNDLFGELDPDDFWSGVDRNSEG
jgi:NADH:ubiquinone oxidoreductase subunit C